MRHTRRHLLWAAAGLGAVRPVWAQSEVSLTLGGSRLIVQMEDGFDSTQRRLILDWVRSSGQAVAGYLGRFPLAQCELLLQRVDGAGVKGGTTFPEPAPYIRIRLGRDTAALHLADDWVLPHEMIHLAIPQVPRRQNWLHEGLATYVEGVARVRAGLNTAPRLWAELVRGLPQGQPQAGDRGLDHTPTWGRTYWGGAMFCLLADVRLLQRSQLRLGLREALQGVQAAGGSYAVAWPVQRILETADRATGQSVLVELHEAMKDSAEPQDLARLWRELGVLAPVGRSAPFDDQAPLAAVRRAIA